MTTNKRNLINALTADASEAGIGVYRSHLDEMEAAIQLFDFNKEALLRLSERVKDALDPVGIPAPGKNGMWPLTCRDKQ